MSGVPNVFGSATSSIPLSQLDVNFNTPLYIGNTSVGLGNTVTSFGNVTLVNATLTSANVSISGGTANGVVYINSSNVAVASPTVLSFTGTNLGIGTSSPSYLLTLSGGNLGFTSGTNGIIFNNSSALTNSTLNDYETGTWTPNQGAGLTVVGAFSSSGTYTKIGNLVYVTGRVNGSTSIALSQTGTLCSSLPFNVLATNPANGYGVLANSAGTSFSAIDAYANVIQNSGTAIAATISIFFNVTYQATF